MVKKRLLCGSIACLMVIMALPTYALAIGYAQTIGKITASEDIDALFDSVCLIEENIKTTILGKETRKSFSPVGGAVSLMVAYIITNEADLEQEIPVIDGVNELSDDVRKIDLKPRQRWLVKDLVAAMLFQGAQDAALLLSDHISASVGAFDSRINEYAARLGMSDTHYTNPLGGYDSEQTTYVSDLAILTEAILENDYLSELLSIPYYDTESGHGIENLLNFVLCTYFGQKYYRNILSYTRTSVVIFLLLLECTLVYAFNNSIIMYFSIVLCTSIIVVLYIHRIKLALKFIENNQSEEEDGKYA